MSAKCSSIPDSCAVVRSISSGVRSSRANRATLVTISTEMRSDTALDARGGAPGPTCSIADHAEAVGEGERAGGQPVLRQHVGTAAGGAEPAMGHVEMHDQLVARPEIGLVGAHEQVLG